MNSNFRFKKITALIFFIFIFWDFFSLDMTIQHGAEAIRLSLSNVVTKRLPVQSFVIVSTYIIFLFNIEAVLESIKKNKLLLILIIYVLLSSFWANKYDDPIKLFIFLMSVYLISIMTALSFNNNNLLVKLLFWLFFFLIIASIITAIIFPQYGINFSHFGKPRWLGITNHPNKLGAMCLISIWVSINYFYQSKRFYEKTFSIINIICSFYTLSGADSMTSFLASAIVLSYTTYHYIIGNKSFSVRILFLCLSAFVLIAVTTLYMSTSEIVNTTLKTSGRDTTLTGRAVLWAVGFDSIEKNPLLGLGFDDLEQLTKESHVLMYMLHNGYIELAVKGGAIATIIFIFILINTFLKQILFRKVYPETFIFLNAGLIGILIHNMAETSLMRGLNGLNIFLFFIFVSTSQLQIKKTLSIQNNTNKKSIFRTNDLTLKL